MPSPCDVGRRTLPELSVILRGKTWHPCSKDRMLLTKRQSGNLSLKVKTQHGNVAEVKIVISGLEEKMDKVSQKTEQMTSNWMIGGKR